MRGSRSDAKTANRPIRSGTGEILREVLASDFLCGANDRGFTADLEWLLRPENFLKTIEGRYDRRASGGNGNGQGNHAHAR